MATTPQTRIPLVSITLMRAEGTSSECSEAAMILASVEDSTSAFDDPFIRASMRLAVWSLTAPERGYHKIDFEIKWQDGSEYKGRFDLSRGGSNNLREHVRRNLEFLAGTWTPPHMTKAQHDAYLNEIYHERGRSDQIDVARQYLADRGGL